MFKLFLRNSFVLALLIGCSQATVKTTSSTTAPVGTQVDSENNGVNLETIKKSDYCDSNRSIRKISVGFSTRYSSSTKEALDTRADQLKEFEQRSDIFAKNIFVFMLSVAIKAKNSLSPDGIYSNPIPISDSIQIQIAKSNQDIPLSLAQLNEQYTFIISKEDQINLMGNLVKLQKGIRGEELCVNFIGLKQDCSFSPSIAIKDKDRAWNYYLTSFNVVKKSSSDSGVELNYLVDLDFDFFCKNSIPVKDLLTN